MNILVTGSNGQLGSEIRKVAPRSPHHFVFTDIAELDITRLDDIAAFIAREQIQVIINCAAYTNVDRAEEDPETANLINHLAVQYLATAAKAADATLIHISTDYVFRGERSTPCQEDWATHPIGIYGQTKLDGERAILNSGVKHLIFRTAWLYSAFGNNFVKTMLRLTAEREQISVVFDQVGTPTHAADLAQLIVQIIDSDQLHKEGIYHFSNEGVCSWYDFAQEIAVQAGHTSCEILPCHSNEFPSKVQRPHFSVLDKTKVKQTFGIKIPYWKHSLHRCLQELNNTPPPIRKICKTCES